MRRHDVDQKKDSYRLVELGSYLRVGEMAQVSWGKVRGLVQAGPPVTWVNGYLGSRRHVK